jgi:hypothetical protein
MDRKETEMCPTKWPSSIGFPSRIADNFSLLTRLYSLICSFYRLVYLTICNRTDKSAPDQTRIWTRTPDAKLTTQLYDKRDDFSFTIVNFPLYVATSHYHLHTGYTSLNWFDMQGPALHISFWVEVDYWQTSWCYRDFYSLVWCQRFTSSMAVTMI